MLSNYLKYKHFNQILSAEPLVCQSYLLLALLFPFLILQQATTSDLLRLQSAIGKLLDNPAPLIVTKRELRTGWFPETFYFTTSSTPFPLKEPDTSGERN